MSRAVMAMCVACVVACGAAVAGPVSGDSPPDGDIAIQASPGTIALDAKNVWLTIHADIPLGVVNVEDRDYLRVAVNGVSVPWEHIFADSLGDLVVKCPIDDVKGILNGASSATVELSGITKAGEPFAGSDTVKVVAGGPK
ncbi:hypothetical protein ACFL09_02405 [Planctomycetota bacterium]